MRIPEVARTFDAASEDVAAVEGSETAADGVSFASVFAAQASDGGTKTQGLAEGEADLGQVGQQPNAHTGGEGGELVSEGGELATPQQLRSALGSDNGAPPQLKSPSANGTAAQLVAATQLQAAEGALAQLVAAGEGMDSLRRGSTMTASDPQMARPSPQAQTVEGSRAQPLPTGDVADQNVEVETSKPLGSGDGAESTDTTDAAATTRGARRGDAVRVARVQAASDASAAADARALRQAAATSAVNRMTLRHGAQAELVDPHLGRIAVQATVRRGEVDVDVRAQAVETVSMLRSAGHQLENHLRNSSIELGNLNIDHDGSDAETERDGGDARRRQDGHEDGETWRHEQRDQQPAEDGAPPADDKRVRIVL